MQHSLQELREREKAELRERERKMEEMLASEQEENRKRQEESDREYMEIRRQLQKDIATDNKRKFVLGLIGTLSSVVIGVISLCVSR